MGYVIFECSAPGCQGAHGYYVRDIDADGFERWHGYFDDKRTHTLRKTGEAEKDPMEHLSIFSKDE